MSREGRTRVLSNPDRLTIPERERIRAEVAAFPWHEHPRPTHRDDCLPGGINEARPCPWVACKYHLYLDVNLSGNVRLNFPDREPGDLETSCALDVADAPSSLDRDGHTLEEVGAATNVTRERIRQIERKAFRRLRQTAAHIENGEPPPKRKTMSESIDATAVDDPGLAHAFGPGTGILGNHTVPPLTTEQRAQLDAMPPAAPADPPAPHNPKAPCAGCKRALGRPAVDTMPDPRLSKFCGNCRSRIRTVKGSAILHGFDWKVVAYHSQVGRETRPARDAKAVGEIEREFGLPPAAEYVSRGVEPAATPHPYFDPSSGPRSVRPALAPPTPAQALAAAYRSVRPPPVAGRQCSHDEREPSCTECNRHKSQGGFMLEKTQTVNPWWSCKCPPPPGANPSMQNAMQPPYVTECPDCHARNPKALVPTPTGLDAGPYVKTTGTIDPVPTPKPVSIMDGAVRPAAWSLSFRTTMWALGQLQRLAESGRYGHTAEDVAEELLRAKLREIEKG